eukprot:g2979.t1
MVGARQGKPYDHEAAVAFVLELCPEIRPEDRGRSQPKPSMVDDEKTNDNSSTEEKEKKIPVSKKSNFYMGLGTRLTLHKRKSSTTPSPSILSTSMSFPPITPLSPSATLEKEFLDACRYGNVEEAIEKIKDNVNIHCVDDKRRTALHLAAQIGDEILVGHLLSGKLAFSAAKLQSNDPNKLLIRDYRCKVDAKDNSGWTPLHAASFAGKTVTVRQLLQAGARADARAKDRSTCLHLAAYWGRNQVVSELILANPKVTLCKDRWGRLAEDIAYKAVLQNDKTLLKAAQMSAILREKSVQAFEQQEEEKRIEEGAEVRYDYVPGDPNNGIAGYEFPFTKFHFIRKYGESDGNDRWRSAYKARPSTALRNRRDQFLATRELEKQMAAGRLTAMDLKLVGSVQQMKRELRQIKSDSSVLNRLIHVQKYGDQDDGNDNNTIPKAVLIETKDNCEEYKVYPSLEPGAGSFDFFWLKPGKNKGDEKIRMILRRGQKVRYRWPNAKDRKKGKNNATDFTDLDPLWRRFQGDPYYVLGAQVLATVETKEIMGSVNDEKAEKDNSTETETETVTKDMKKAKTGKDKSIGRSKAPPDLRSFERGRIRRLNPDGSFGILFDFDTEIMRSQEDKKKVFDLFVENLKYPILRKGIRIEMQYSKVKLRGKKHWFAGTIEKENGDGRFTIQLDKDSGAKTMVEKSVAEDNIRLPEEKENEKLTTGMDDDSIKKNGMGKVEKKSGKKNRPFSVVKAVNENSSQGNIPLNDDTIKLVNLGKNYASLESQWCVTVGPFDTRPMETVIAP